MNGHVQGMYQKLKYSFVVHWKQAFSLANNAVITERGSVIVESSVKMSSFIAPKLAFSGIEIKSKTHLLKGNTHMPLSIYAFYFIL